MSLKKLHIRRVLPRATNWAGRWGTKLHIIQVVPKAGKFSRQFSKGTRGVDNAGLLYTSQRSEVSVSPTLVYSWESPDITGTMQKEADFHCNEAYVFKGNPAGWLEPESYSTTGLEPVEDREDAGDVEGYADSHFPKQINWPLKVACMPLS
jgi:hypothetical protein